MKRTHAILLLALSACSPAQTNEVNAGWNNEPAPVVSQAEKAIRVVGHVLDRSTGEPVGGARIEAPGGRTAVSDSVGYFEITGFLPGEEGELTATWGKEKTARAQLRPLAPGSLEIVLYLGR